MSIVSPWDRVERCARGGYHAIGGIGEGGGGDAHHARKIINAMDGSSPASASMSVCYDHDMTFCIGTMTTERMSE